MTEIKTETAAHYFAPSPQMPTPPPSSPWWSDDDQILARARAVARSRLASGAFITSPTSAYDALQALIGDREHEVFAIVYLTTQNRIITHEELFRGTVNAASVYPREIVKNVLSHNVAAVLLAHNHPSGEVQPSQADRSITTKIQQALEYIDVDVLDHIIVSPSDRLSFKERGLL